MKMAELPRDAIYHYESDGKNITVTKTELVRCWECELWNDWDSAGHKELGNFVCSCAHWTNEDGYVVYTKPEDFCSYSERKDGAE